LINALALYRKEKVWDPFIRTWHWLLLVTVVSGWLLGTFRTFSIMQWHMYAGYATGVLLLFRIYWGFAGPEPVRFRALWVTPSRLFAYLSRIHRPEPSGVAGHNPLGALSVIAMLVLLLIQVGTGLFAEDDALFHEGPLSSMVSDSLVLRFTSLHHITALALQWVIGLHVAAILFYYFWKKENLVGAMIHGWKTVKRPESENTQEQR